MREIFIMIGICYFGLLALFFLLLWIAPKWFVQDYPKELEEQDNEEIRKKFERES